MSRYGPPLWVPSGIPGHVLLQGSHACHLYYGREHLLITAGLFVHAALKNHEKCFLCLDDELAERFEFLLAELAAPSVRRRHLAWLDPEHVGRMFSSPTADIQKAFMEKLVDEPLRRGFVGVRLVGQMDMMQAALGRDRVAFAERLMNQVLPGLPAVILCEYPYDKTNPAAVRELYRVHKPYCPPPPAM